MFLNSLNYEQKKVFLSMAKQILISDDGTIDSDEENYLMSICNEMSLGKDDEISYENDILKEIFTSKEESRLILVELIALAYSNGKYHENEKKFILNIINAMDLKEDILKDIEILVKTYFETQKSIVAFIAPEEA